VGTTPGSCVSQDGVVGFTVDVTRIFRQGGRQVRTERFRTVYQPEDRVLCGSSGPRRPTPGPTASPGPTPSPVPSD
jgi:hypothetical protein